jgi:hypothetical protein
MFKKKEKFIKIVPIGEINLTETDGVISAWGEVKFTLEHNLRTDYFDEVGLITHCRRLTGMSFWDLRWLMKNLDSEPYFGSVEEIREEMQAYVEKVAEFIGMDKNDACIKIVYEPIAEVRG